MLEKKTGKGGIQIRGGRGYAKRVSKSPKKNRENLKGYPNPYDQSSSHAIIPGKGM